MSKDQGLAAFVMPHYTADFRKTRPWLEEAVSSIVNQSETGWRLIIVDDASPEPEVGRYLKDLEQSHDGSILVALLGQNRGQGNARNIGIELAAKSNCDFVMFLDADDLAHPNRLSVTRKLFSGNDKVGVVYSTFTVIDEDSKPIDSRSLTPSIREILETHETNPPSGPNVWIRIATETGYVNLTSSTSVRTRLASIVPFPAEKVSEDFYTWMVYSAAGADFLYTSDVPSAYRIPSYVQGSLCRVREGGTHAFNVAKTVIDTRALYRCVEYARERRNLSESEIIEIKVDFFIGRAASMLSDGEIELARDYCVRAQEVNRDLFFRRCADRRAVGLIELLQGGTRLGLFE